MSTAGAMSTLASNTYQPLDGDLTAIAGITGVQGDVLYFNGSAWVALGYGVSGQYLQTQGSGANPQWASTAISGDIETVGDVTSGSAFAGSGGNTLYFEGATANEYEIALTGADPGADYTITLPATTGTVLLTDGTNTDDAVLRSDGTGSLAQTSGVIIDDSNNVSGLASLSLGSNPADAGTIRLENAASIVFEDTEGTGEVTALTVTSAEVLVIGDANTTSVTITPATTVSGALTLSSTLTDGTATLNAGAWSGITTISMGNALTLSDGATLDQSADNYVGFTENSDSIQFYFGGTDVDIVWSDGVLNIRNNEDSTNAIVEIEGKDAGERGELRVLSDGDDKHIAIYHDDTNSFVYSSSGNIILAADGDTDDYIMIDTTTNVPSISPDSADGGTIGTTSTEWSDAYFADGAVIYFGNDQDVTLTHVADTGLRIEDNIQLILGTNSDWGVYYDETTDDRLEFVHAAGAGADVYFDLNDNAAASTFSIVNSDGTYAANLVVDGTISEGGTSLVSKYQGLDADLTALAGITGVQGDILYYNGSAWVALGYGTLGYFLQTRGSGANPLWAAGSATGVAGTFAAGWNGDTAAPQKNDLYDYLVQVDADISGTVDLDELGNPGASKSFAMGAYALTFTSGTDGWDGVTISNTQAAITAGDDLLTLQYTDGEGDNTGEIDFLKMIANSVTLYEFDEDAFKLGSGGVIDFYAGDVTITHSSNTLAFAGGTSYTFDATVTATSYSTSASTAPTLTLADSSASEAGTGDIKVDAATAGQDSSLRLYVDDSTGEDTLYVTVDGTNEEILFAKKIDLTSAGIENVGNIVDDGSFTIASSGAATTVKILGWDTGGGYDDMITITNGADPTMSFAADGGITIINDTTFSGIAKAYFRDTAIYISSGADGYLDIEADTAVRIAAPVQDVTSLTMGSATVDTGVFTMIKGAQTSDPQVTFTLSADGVGGFTIATANGSNGDITITPSGGETIITTDLTVSGGDIVLGTTSIFSGGDTASLNNIDAIDATTEATVESAIDTLTNLSSVGGAANGSIAIMSGQTAANTLKLQGRDTTDAGAWDDVITITAGETPTLAIAADGGVTIQSVTLAGGSNTFSLTNGSASLDIAASATLNIDTSLTVQTGAVTLTGNASGSTLVLPSGSLTLGTMAAAATGDYALVGQQFYIGTTQVAINRGSAALTLAGITLTTPDIGAATGTSLAFGADPADAGAVRLSNNTNIAWEIAATGTDATFGVNATDDMVAALVAATDLFQITTGNLKIGAGAQTQTLDGADGYITGFLEVDGVIYADGGVTGTLTGTASGNLALTGGTLTGNVALDDGVTNSPTLTFQDATDETTVFEKVDSGYLTITTVAADGVNILTGNLKVGDGSPGQTINGEDVYINGLLEVDGVIYSDGGILLGTTNQVQFGDTGTYINQGADGYLDMTADTGLDLNVGAEGLRLTAGTNVVNVATGDGMGVTAIDFGSLNMVTTGTIQGAIKYVPIDSTDADDAYTIASADGYGVMVTNAGDDDALTVNLPDVAIGMNICVGVIAAFAVTIEPNGSERIIVDTNTNGDYVTNAGTAGDFYCLMGVSATEWMPMGKKGTWSEQ
jgi:hypothetical protein